MQSSKINKNINNRAKNIIKRKNKNKNINKNANIDKLVSQLKLGSNVSSQMSRTTSETPYINALILPESAQQAKLPGLADMSIALHRKNTYNLVTNALGAACVYYYPYCLSDISTISTGFNSNIFFSSSENPTFNGTTTNGSNTPIAQICNFNVTTGAVSQYRCVSASIHIIPQSSVLNQAGSIHASLIPLPSRAPTVPGNTLSSPEAASCLIPTLANSTHYAEASVSAMEGMRIIWLPNDECLLEFSNVNTSVATSDNNSNFNAMVATIVGTVPGSLFRIDTYANYEIVPTSTSVLVGMETLCTHNERPQSVWRNVLLKHCDDITKPIKSSKVSANMLNTPILKSPDGLSIASKQAMLSSFYDKYFANNWINENSTELHYPGLNYMGPGTHIIGNILSDKRPKSYTDTIALKHDIDYLTQEEPIISDFRAIVNSGFDLQGLAMKTGLGIRSVLDALMHLVPILPNFTHINGRQPNDINLPDDVLIPLLRDRSEALVRLSTDFNFI